LTTSLLTTRSGSEPGDAGLVELALLWWNSQDRPCFKRRGFQQRVNGEGIVYRDVGVLARAGIGITVRGGSVRASVHPLKFCTDLVEREWRHDFLDPSARPLDYLHQLV
jgi:hypothetical protein